MKQALYYLLGLSFVSLGCSPRLDFRKHHVVQQIYENEKITLSNYFLCVGLTNNHNTYSFRKAILHSQEEFGDLFNRDSIFNYFTSAISKLDILVALSDSAKGFCDNSFYENARMKIDKLDMNRIKDIARDSGLVLVPVIYLDNQYTQHVYMGSSGVAGGGAYIKQTIVRVLIVMLDGDKVVYLSSAQHFGETYESIDIKDKRNNIEQEHWDKLVEKAMENYIKRLKDEEKK